MTSPTLPDQTSDPVTSSEEHLVVVRVHGSDFGVPIHRVQEIVRTPSITRVPRAPAGVEGVINLRGRVLPVVDLGQRLGLGPVASGGEGRVVVVEQAESAVGFHVEAVSEVLRVAGSEIAPPSEAAIGQGPSAVRGVAKLGDRLVLLLDLEAALRS